MMKNYETKDMRADGKATALSLVCVQECVTPGVGKGCWLPGDETDDAATVAALTGNPFFKTKAEVK